MTEPDPNRPGSAAAAAAAATSAQSPVPPSPRPSVTSRASRSSLQRERQEALAAGTTPSPQPPIAPEPVFAPLFGLLNSTHHPAQRLTTHHPVMHYIFADDDPEILTDALNHHHRTLEDGGSDLDATYLPDRALVLDLAPSEGGGFDVSWASSLSPDWAVVDARVTTMEGDRGGPARGRDSPPGSFVLQVEGVTIGGAATHLAVGGGKAFSPDGETQSPGASGSKQPRKEDYGALIEDFEKRMGVLRRVVEAGEERQRIPVDEDDQGAGLGVEHPEDSSRGASAD